MLPLGTAGLPGSMPELGGDFGGLCDQLHLKNTII